MEDNSGTTSNICRTCMTENGEFQSIFIGDESTGLNVHLAEMIMSYASVHITLGDGLPEDICISCAKQVSSFYLFKQLCEDSDRKLRNKFGLTPYRENEERPPIDLKILKSEFVSFDNQEEEKVQIICEICSKIFENYENFVEHKQTHEEFANTHSQNSMEEEDVEVNVIEINPETTVLIENSSSSKDDSSSSGNDEIEEIVITGPTSENLKLFCDESSEDLIALDVHEYEDKERKTSSSGSGKFECEICKKKFGKSSHLNRHLKIHSAVKPHICVLCGKGFARGEQLTNHMNMHSGVKPHVCKICSKGFNQISNLKDHMRTHNGEKPFLCSTCGKGFNQLGNLRQHTIRHSGIKAHLCSICGNGFASKGELCAHLRKHTGARPFVCSICNHGFTTSSSLTKHKRIHSGEKPYECEVCKMKFSRSGILARHKRTHTGEKPYVCKYCTKAFSQSNDLSSHLRIHTGEKPYICDNCGQAFRQSSALKTHKKTHMEKQPSSSSSSSVLDSKAVIGLVHTSIFNRI